MNKELHNNVATCIMREAQDYTATVTSDLVNLAGFESCEVLVTVGALTGVSGSNTLTAKLQECDTTVGTSFTDVAVADMIGGFTLIDSTAEDSTIQRVGYIGNKKYLRVVLTEAGTISAGIVGVYAILGNPRNSPPSNVVAVAAT
jgi:hypothetical protein